MSGRDAEESAPGPPQVPEVPLVLGAALLAAGALVVQAVLRFGADWADWPGLAAAALALLFVAAAVLAGAPRGWRWVGATVCLHLGLHPALAAAAAGAPLAVLATALAALGAWAALATLRSGAASTRDRRRPAALFLGLLSGVAALVRPDLLALVLPLGALALTLAPAPREARRPALAAFAAATLAAIPLGLLLRWQLFELGLPWQGGALAALAGFVQVNAVTLTAGLSGLALLGLRAWRTAALLYGPLPLFAGAALFLAPALPTPLAALHLPLLPLLPLLAVAFAVLLARALDALPAIRPADDLGRSAALVLGLVYILHLLALDLGSAPPPVGLPV